MLLTSVCVLCVQNCFNELQEIVRVMLKYLGGWGGLRSNITTQLSTCPVPVVSLTTLVYLRFFL